MAIAGIPAGTDVIGAACSGAAAQPEPVNAEAAELVAGVAADQLAGTDKPPAVDAWPKPANTGAPPKPAEPAGPTAPAKPPAAVCALAASGIVAEAPLATWPSNIPVGMALLTHQAAVLTDPLMAFCTNGRLRGLVT
jgi:hypothetical protein